MNKEPLISVIIPAYNAEQYIDKCIFSVRKQSFEDIEILVINDGSKDLTYSIAVKHSAVDSRVRVFHQENKGQGAARNLGIKESKGKYLTFVDADDYYVNDSILETMYKNSEDCDIVVAGAIIDRLGESELQIAFNEKVVLYSNNSCDLLLEYILDSRFMVSCWNKLYKSEIIKNNLIEFKKYGEVLSEDMLFNYCFYPFCNSFIIIPDCGYKQIMHQGSSSCTKGINYAERLICQAEIMKQHSLFYESTLLQKLTYYYITTGMDYIADILLFFGEKVSFNYLQHICKLIKEKKVMKNINNISSVHIHKKMYYIVLSTTLKMNMVFVPTILAFIKNRVKILLKNSVRKI